MGKYRKLIKKLENLEGPDREIDLEVLNALSPHESGDLWVWGAPLVPMAKHSFAVVPLTNEIEAEIAERLDLHEAFNGFARKVPLVTANLNAIIKLSRESYPKAVFTVHDYPEAGNSGVALNRFEYDVVTGDGTAANSAIASCIAILKAKESAHAE